MCRASVDELASEQANPCIILDAMPRNHCWQNLCYRSKLWNIFKVWLLSFLFCSWDSLRRVFRQPLPAVLFTTDFGVCSFVPQAKLWVRFNKKMALEGGKLVCSPEEHSSGSSNRKVCYFKVLLPSCLLRMEGAKSWSAAAAMCQESGAQRSVWQTELRDRDRYRLEQTSAETAEGTVQKHEDVNNGKKKIILGFKECVWGISCILQEGQHLQS